MKTVLAPYFDFDFLSPVENHCFKQTIKKVKNTRSLWFLEMLKERFGGAKSNDSRPRKVRVTECPLIRITMNDDLEAVFFSSQPGVNTWSEWASSA